MGKRRKSKRQHKLIGMKVYFDTDDDILTWWDSIEAGSRSDVLRDLIREAIGITPQRRKTAPVLDLPELVEVRQDTRWLVNALNDMPAYLERVIQRVASAQPVVNQASAGGGQAVGQNKDVLTEEQIKRRTSRLRKATW